MTFIKRTARGKTLLQKGFPPGPSFRKLPNGYGVRGEKRLIWVSAHDKSVHFQLTMKILEFLPEGSGTGFLHKKRVPEIFPLPSSPGLLAEQKQQSYGE
jgi:hypothetical protein